MTDRYNALTVVLDRDIRSDDAKALISAIQQLRGVLRVDPHVAELTNHIAESRVRRELYEKLLNLLIEEPPHA